MCYFCIVKSINDSKLQSLLERVRELTSGYGERVKLAADLDVDPQHLNSWLRGRRCPNGDYTLRLLEWVQANGGKKQSAPGRGSNTARSKTRLTHQINEKRKSGPPKR